MNTFLVLVATMNAAASITLVLRFHMALKENTELKAQLEDNKARILENKSHIETIEAALQKRYIL